MQEFNFTSAGSPKHYAVDWDCHPAKAVIVLVHGLGEHCRRYDHLAAFFNEKGIAILGYDHAGHGQTAGKRGHARNMEVLIEGVSTMLENAKKRYPGIPLFLYGHSMGGNIVLNYILRKRPALAGAIATGPFIRMVVEPSAILEGMGRILHNLLPSVTQSNGLNPEMISSDREVVQHYIDDPLVHDRISFALAIALLNGARWLNQYRGDCPVPLLVMHGADDQITSPLASREFADRLTSEVVYREWSDLYHEIHNEAEQRKVFIFTVDWIEKMINKSI